jgi:heme-degrading monooxygenase HmoA
VVFTSLLRPESRIAYATYSRRMAERVATMPGFLGMEGVRSEDGAGVTLCYWASREAIRGWARDEEHRAVQQRGQQEWYADYHLATLPIVSHPPAPPLGPVAWDVQAHADTVPWDLLLSADPSRERIQAYLAGGELLVARSSDGIVGAAVWTSTAAREGELMNIAVASVAQRQGVATGLVGQVVARARATGLSRLVVGTGNSSLGPLALYRRTGFRLSAVDFNYFPRHYPEPIYEDGVPCLDRIRLTLDL